MTTEAKVGEADRAYFNGGIQRLTTESSILISNSAYLNHAGISPLSALAVDAVAQAATGLARGGAMPRESS